MHQSRKNRRPSKDPMGSQRIRQERHSKGRAGRRSSPGRDTFLSKFKGLCFRCLSSLHRRVDCRDPLHCIICKLPGHYGTECPKNQRNKLGSGSMKERLGRGPVRERLVFPNQATTPTTTPPQLPPMEPAPAIDHGRRPRNSHEVIASTPELEHQIFLLRQHAVVVTAVGTTRHAASLCPSAGRWRGSSSSCHTCSG